MIKNTLALETAILSIGFLAIAAYPVAAAMAIWMTYRYVSSVKRVLDSR